MKSGKVSLKDLFSNEEIKKLPPMIQLFLSGEKARGEMNQRVPKINSEPRDWFAPIEEPTIFGASQEPFFVIVHLMIKPSVEQIEIHGCFPKGPLTMEIFTTREKVDSFIDALSQTRDAVFPE